MPEQPITHVSGITGPLNTGRGDIIIQRTPPPAPLEPGLALSKVEGPPALRVLTVVARPLDQSALPEIGDAWSLADKLAQVQAPIELAFARPPTVETLRRRLAEDWDVVHFDGHGVWAWTCPACGAFIPKEEGQPDPSACPRCDAVLTEPASGYLAFEREDGLLDLLPATEMAALLCPPGMKTDAPPRARLAILTACQSAMGSPSLAGVLLAAGVPAVLAMRESVTVGAVVTLLPPFYANLGAGRTPRQALDAALPALRSLGTSPLSGTPLTGLPVLEGPGAETPLCEPGGRAHTRVEREALVGVPAPSPSGAFHGDFEPADPPGGRKGYLARLARALGRGEKLVVLTGIGGIGKSALAAAAARRMAWRYPGHVYGEEFGKLPVARQRELALDYLRRIQAPALLVVDNGDVADEGVFRFLQDVPRPSAVLVTTRTAPEYGACVLDVTAMTPQEGLTFLAAEIGRRRNDPRWVLRVDEMTARKLLQVAELLDGHALALLQAAALAGDVGLDYALAQAWANPARGETARRFDFSYNPLPEVRKELLHRLAAFAAYFDRQAIAAVCSSALTPSPLPDLGEGRGPGGGVRAWDAHLPELVRASFVEHHPLGPGYDRFRLHPVMREYLRRKAGAEMAAHDRRFARYFTTLAGWGGRQLGDPETALQAVAMATLERANFLAAQEVCLAQELWDEAVRLAYDLDVLFERSGHWADRQRALEAGVEAAKRGSDKRQVALLANNLGIAYQQMGEYTGAQEQYEASLRGLEEIGEERSIPYARALHQLGMLAQDTGDYAEARRLYQEAAETFEQLGAQREQAAVLHQLGMLAQDTGDYAEARRLYQEALAIAQQLGNRAGVAKSLHQLGNVAYLQGDYAGARRLYQESLAIKQQLGNRAGVAYTLGQLGNLAYAQGNLDEARQLYEQVCDVSEQMGDRKSVATALHQLGVLAQATGDYAEARRLYQESLAIRQQLGDRAGVAKSLHQLGMLAQATGDYAEARRLYQESLAIKQQLGDRAGVAQTLNALASIAFAEGDRDTARQLLSESLQLAQGLGDRLQIACASASLALVEEAEGNLDLALKLIREAEAIFSALGSPMAAQARRVRERLEGNCQRIRGAD